MLIRTVRMTFRPDRLEAFLEMFWSVRPQIAAAPGCQLLELWRDARYPNVLTTYSEWSHPDDLEAYRQSALFRETWARTKPLFAAAPVAQSQHRLEAGTTDLEDDPA
ncbi:putative quinol monooxygenase [Rubrivirga sp.]|uniref:putative quinol monooxygenase n=1 Tax=Rubrivirga sp. TaxID=1885344 RepID=UPI003C77A42C